MTRDAGACPDLETLAACLDRRLPSAERQRIAVHAAACEICEFVLTEAARTRRRHGPTIAARRRWFCGWLVRRTT